MADSMTRTTPHQIEAMRADLRRWGFSEVDEMPDFVVRGEHEAEAIDRAVRLDRLHGDALKVAQLVDSLAEFSAEVQSYAADVWEEIERAPVDSAEDEAELNEAGDVLDAAAIIRHWLTR